MTPEIYKSIQGWFSYKWLYELASYRFKDNATFIEIGNWKGQSLMFLKEITDINCIDCWIYGIDGQFYDNVAEELRHNILESNLYLTNRNIELLKGDSSDSAKGFEDNSVDFVFIDAGHQYHEVKKDIEAWLPKVKSKGWVCFHDINSSIDPGVDQAIEELLGLNKLIIGVDTDYFTPDPHCVAPPMKSGIYIKP